MKEIEFENFVVIPSKIVCVGRNYIEHIKELNNQMPKEMVVFIKPNSSASKEIYYFNDNYRYEGELCYLIQDKNIVGIGFGLDLTNKKAQEYAKKNGLPWERAKAFDNAAVFSDFIRYEGDLKDLSFKLFINNTLAQEGSYELMIYKPYEIIDEIESFMSLNDGDIIMSGTPKGVGSYKKDDIFEAFIYEKDKEILNYKWEVK